MSLRREYAGPARGLPVDGRTHGGGTMTSAEALRRHTEWLESFRRDIRRQAALDPPLVGCVGYTH
jgi:hypothetical protein